MNSQHVATVGDTSGTFKEVKAGENPGVFTQASCYLPWLAKLRKVAGTCTSSIGGKNQPRKTICKTNLGTHCDFSRNYQIEIINLDPVVITFEDRCKLIGLEG